MRFVPKKRNDSYVPNPSILELRGIYSEMSEMEYCLFYERRYGIKWKDVQRYLRGANDE